MNGTKETTHKRDVGFYRDIYITYVKNETIIIIIRKWSQIGIPLLPKKKKSCLTVCLNVFIYNFLTKNPFTKSLKYLHMMFILIINILIDNFLAKLVPFLF